MFQFPFRQRFEGNGRAGYRVTSQYADVALKVAELAKPLQAEELLTLFPLAR